MGDERYSSNEGKWAHHKPFANSKVLNPKLKAERKKLISPASYMRLLSSLLLSSSAFVGHHFRIILTLPLHFHNFPRSVSMDSSEGSLRNALSQKQSAVEAQGNAVRALKASGAAKPEIDAAIEALNALKLDKASIEKQLQAVVSGAGGDGGLNRESFRQAVVNTLERRLFYIPSFKIYRGVAGLYDYGPPGCAVKSNVLAFWRQVYKFNLILR